MNHPTSEEWVPYLYGEVEKSTKRRLKQHLQTCAECRTQLLLWKRSLRRLDAWRMTSAERPTLAFAPLLKWAAAAMLLLAAGIGVGRSMSTNANLDRVRARVEPELRQQLRQEFALILRKELEKTASLTLATARDQARTLVADSASNLETKRLESNQAIYSALDRLFLSLKKDVDTVAVYTDASLRRLAQSANGEPASDSTQP
jgi:hypothetical protein